MSSQVAIVPIVRQGAFALIICSIHAPHPVLRRRIVRLKLRVCAMLGTRALRRVDVFK